MVLIAPSFAYQQCNRIQSGCQRRAQNDGERAGYHAWGDGLAKKQMIPQDAEHRDQKSHREGGGAADVPDQPEIQQERAPGANHTQGMSATGRDATIHKHV